MQDGRSVTQRYCTCKAVRRGMSADAAALVEPAAATVHSDPCPYTRLHVTHERTNSVPVRTPTGRQAPSGEQA